MTRLIVDTEDLLTVIEAITELNIGYATLYRWIKKRTIVSVKLSGKTYIPREEIARIKANK